MEKQKQNNKQQPCTIEKWQFNTFLKNLNSDILFFNKRLREEEVIEEHIGDPLEHTHEDGTSHSHEGGDVDHTHDKPKKSMMSKLFS